MAGFRQRKWLRDQSITQAWLTVSLALGTKGLPPLEKLLSTTVTKQTPQQQRSMMQQIAAQYGIELEETQLIQKH